ncbi:MAG: GAF domain-containing protein [Gemmatimonadaceae bacterium]|nr:GAF domain-containing protein [Gemmatimonadaceae bacterium]
MRPPSADTLRAAPPRHAQLLHDHLGALAIPSDGVLTASLRLRALAALSGSFTDAVTPQVAADLIEKVALSVLGAASAVVVTLGEFPPALASANAADALPLIPALSLVHAIGVPAEVRAALQSLPLDAPQPLAQVARDGEAVFLSSEAELRRYSEWGDAMIRVGARAAATVPVWANGELRGVLGLTWDAPRLFDEDERAFVITLGVMCAQAIMRAHLRVAEQQAREEAQRANRSKARFLATISHELRTPINAVMGYTALLAEEISGPVSALQKQHLARVRASSVHLLDLVEELLSYARIEAGEEVVRAEDILASVVIEQSLVLVRPMAEKKGLGIRVEGHAEPLELFTDARKLRQILVNLLANAVKYTERGDIVLILRVAGADTDAQVYFEVTDTGRGINVENHERIFDAFWQEDGTTTHRVGSTGLGLSVARELARLLGGDVLLARSAVTRGSTFVMSMPTRYVESGSAA